MTNKTSRTPTPVAGEEGKPSLPRHMADLVEKFLDLGSSIVSVAAATAMIVILTINTFLRYAAGSGIFWTGEFVALAFPWMVMGGAVLAFRRNFHISVELIVGRLPATLHRTVAIAIQIMIAITCFYVVSSSSLILKVTSSQSFSTLGLSLAYAYSALPVGFTFIGLLAVKNAVFPPVPETEWIEAADSIVHIDVLITKTSGQQEHKS